MQRAGTQPAATRHKTANTRRCTRPSSDLSAAACSRYQPSCGRLLCAAVATAAPACSAAAPSCSAAAAQCSPSRAYDDGNSHKPHPSCRESSAAVVCCHEHLPGRAECAAGNKCRQSALQHQHTGRCSPAAVLARSRQPGRSLACTNLCCPCPSFSRRSSDAPKSGSSTSTSASAEALLSTTSAMLLPAGVRVDSGGTKPAEEQQTRHTISYNTTLSSSRLLWQPDAGIFKTAVQPPSTSAEAAVSSAATHLPGRQVTSKGSL